jgi:hypothetical protein
MRSVDFVTDHFQRTAIWVTFDHETWSAAAVGNVVWRRRVSDDDPRSRMGFLWFRHGLLRSTPKGFATRACDLCGCACEVTAAAPKPVGACRAGMVPAARREPTMSTNLTLAQNHAHDLACTLMVPVTLFEVDGSFCVMPTADLDDEDVTVIHEYDPWSPTH